MQISLCIQLRSQLELHQWQDRFAASQKRDHDEAVAWLSEIHNSQTIMHGIVEETSADVKALMAFMQNVRIFTSWPIPLHLITGCSPSLWPTEAITCIMGCNATFTKCLRALVSSYRTSISSEEK
jgi:hypothetical protein